MYTETREFTHSKRRRIKESTDFYRTCFSIQNRNFILQIFRYLDPKDVVMQCLPVSKAWRRAILESYIWDFYEKRYGVLSRLTFNPNKILCERRSKGKLYIGTYFGFKEHKGPVPPFNACNEAFCENVVANSSAKKSTNFDLGTNDSKNTKKVCIRCIDLSLCNANSDDGVTTSCLRECAYLQKLSHPNIIKYYGAQTMKNKMYIITEYIEYNLDEYIKFIHRESVYKCEHYFKTLIFPVLKDILRAVNYLHGMNVIHRNIKPENIFVIFKEDMENGAGNGIKYACAKVGDIYMGRLAKYGKGCYTPEESKERAMSFRECRRMQYKAPEMLLRSRLYGNEVDLWSIGNIFYELVCNKNLFSGTNEISLVWEIFRTVGFPDYMEVEHLPEKMYNIWSSITTEWEKIEYEDVVKASNNVTDEEKICKYYSKSGQRESFENLLTFCRNIGTTSLFVLYGLLNTNGSLRFSADYLLKCEKFWRIGRGECCSCGNGSQHEDGLSGKCVDYCHPEDGFTKFSKAEGVDNRYKPSDALNDEIYNLDNCLVVVNGLNTALKDYRKFIVHWYFVVQKAFQLSDETIHFAIGYFLKYIHYKYKETNEASKIPIDISIVCHIYISCLKIADRFNEKSQEYYKTNDACEYANFANNTLNLLPHIRATYRDNYVIQAHKTYEINRDKIIETEKKVLIALNYDLSTSTLYFCVGNYGQNMNICQESCVFKHSIFLSNVCIHFSELDQFSNKLKAKAIWLISLYRHLSVYSHDEYMEIATDFIEINKSPNKMDTKPQCSIPDVQNFDFAKKVQVLHSIESSPKESKVLANVDHKCTPNLSDDLDVLISRVAHIMGQLDRNQSGSSYNGLWETTKCIAYIEHFSTCGYEKLRMDGYLNVFSLSPGHCDHVDSTYRKNVPIKATTLLLDKSFHEHVTKLGDQSCRQFVQMRV